MFKEKTVLILGAGASCHVGYPTGDELLKKMIYTSYCPENRAEEQHLSRFGNLLKEMQPLMIDTFLSYHTDYHDIGKKVLAHEIFNVEENYEEREGEKGFIGNWYKFLIDALITGCEKPEDIHKNNENLTIVTFNYDISLEYYLIDRLKKIKFFEGEVEKFCNELEIIHVYGQLEKFDCLKKYSWDPEENTYEKLFYTDAYKYIQNKSDRLKTEELYYFGSGGYKRSDSIRLLSNNIEIIGNEKWGREDKRISYIQEKVSGVVSESKRVYALGFGFHNPNINIIKLNKHINQCQPTMNNQLYYINFGDSVKIDRKIFQSMIVEKNRDRNIIKSIKTIDRAFAEDFDLID